MSPFVSVIIPCRNEAVSIACCLESVLASSYPADRMEILVADGMSEDGTRPIVDEIARRDARVRRIDNAARITPVALNRAIEASRGDLILRIDAHSVVAPNYISELVRFLEMHPQASGAGGRMRTEAETAGAFSRAISIVLSHRFGVGNSGFRTHRQLTEPFQVDTVFNCCWPRDVFRRVGLFHERLVRSQDIEMSSRIARAGGALYLVPRAHTTYFARTDFAGYLHRNWSNGVWSLVPVIFLGRLPVRWRHLVPLAFVSSIALAILLAAIDVAPISTPLIPLVPYTIANLLISFLTAWHQRDWRLAFLLPPAFAGLHFGYGAGSLWGALRVAAHLLRGTPATPVPILSSTTLSSTNLPSTNLSSTNP